MYDEARNSFKYIAKKNNIPHHEIDNCIFEMEEYLYQDQNKTQITNRSRNMSSDIEDSDSDFELALNQQVITLTGSLSEMCTVP